MANNKLTKKVGFSLFDLFFFAGFVYYLIFHVNLDPGDVVIIYVFENIFMLAGYVCFSFIFMPWAKTYYKKRVSKVERFQEKSFFKTYLSELVTNTMLICVGLVIGAIFIVLFDQILIEFAVGYFTDNGFVFKSLQILGQEGLFFQPTIINPLMEHLQIDLVVLFLIIGTRYFIEFTIDLFAGQKHKTLSGGFKGMFAVASHVLFGPIVMLFCMLLLVLLSSIWGPQSWMVALILILFRLGVQFVMLVLHYSDGGAERPDQYS